MRDSIKAFHFGIAHETSWNNQKSSSVSYTERKERNIIFSHRKCWTHDAHFNISTHRVRYRRQQRFYHHHKCSLWLFEQHHLQSTADLRNANATIVFNFNKFKIFFAFELHAEWEGARKREKKERWFLVNSLKQHSKPEKKKIFHFIIIIYGRWQFWYGEWSGRCLCLSNGCGWVRLLLFHTDSIKQKTQRPHLFNQRHKHQHSSSSSLTSSRFQAKN